MAQFLSGKEVADVVLTDVKKRVETLKNKGKQTGLGTILVGDDPASAGYVRKKHETCETVGIRSFHLQVPASATQNDLLQAVDSFNSNPEVDSYIIQYPVPAQFDYNAALLRMDPGKDADGLHPVNLGKLVLQENGPRPCTPAGIMAMLAHFNIPIAGREVVIVGRGPTLGRPLALLLSMKHKHANAVVTVVHSGVKDISAYTRRAEVLISAVGMPSIIKPAMVKEGAVVISGGISWEGKRLSMNPWKKSPVGSPRDWEASARRRWRCFWPIRLKHRKQGSANSRCKERSSTNERCQRLLGVVTFFSILRQPQPKSRVAVNFVYPNAEGSGSFFQCGTK
jgi:methylenetetrahydrofolate dehydrogenase (NADP+)/methenyltetrahydrofolate cyclohydrolase